MALKWRGLIAVLECDSCNAEIESKPGETAPCGAMARAMRRFKRQIRSVNGRVLAFDMRNGIGAAMTPLLERIVRGSVDDAELQTARARRSIA